MMNSPINKMKMSGLDPAIFQMFQAAQQQPVPEMGPVNTAQVKGPSLWDKIQGGLMPVPAGMEGLLSPDELQAGRNQGLLSMGASLLADSGPKTADQYVSPGAAVGRAIQAGQGAMQQPLANKMNMLGLQSAKAELEGKQDALARQKALAGVRQRIIQSNPMPEGGDMHRMRDWIDDVLPQFIEANDEETVAKLSQIRSTIQGNQQAKEPGEFVTVPGPDGRPMRRYATREEMGQGMPEYERPHKDSNATLMDEQRMFSRSNMLGDDYRSVTSSIQKAADQYRTMTAAAEGARAKSPQAQIALVFSFMKTLDPTSVVRESEYATAANAAGVPERIRNQYNKLLKGAFLSPEQIEGFLKEGRAAAHQWRRQQDLHRKTFSRRAERWRIDPDDVAIDFFDGLETEPEKLPTKWHAPMVLPRANQMFPEKK